MKENILIFLCFFIRLFAFSLVPYISQIKEFPFLNTRFYDFDSILEGIFLLE